MFWRNPAQGLIGAYGDFTDWDRFGGVHAGHAGPEGELYYGQWTVQGVAGAEFGNTRSGTVGTFIQTSACRRASSTKPISPITRRTISKSTPADRYLGGKNAAAFGGEWGIPMNNGIMAALFAEGRVGEHSEHGVWGGVRFYFGQKDKTLIRRHREDDPTTWSNGANSTFSGGGSQTPVPTSGGGPG